jgi:hypothetical protein
MRRAADASRAVQEVREKLEQLDLATSRAQGWLRGKDARQRLAAMETLTSGYPARAHGAADSDASRIPAGNPFAMFTQGLWQQRAPRQVCANPCSASLTISSNTTMADTVCAGCQRITPSCCTHLVTAGTAGTAGTAHACCRSRPCGSAACGCTCIGS